MGETYHLHPLHIQRHLASSKPRSGRYMAHVLLLFGPLCCSIEAQPQVSCRLCGERPGRRTRPPLVARLKRPQQRADANASSRCVSGISLLQLYGRTVRLVRLLVLRAGERDCSLFRGVLPTFTYHVTPGCSIFCSAFFLRLHRCFTPFAATPHQAALNQPPHRDM